MKDAYDLIVRTASRIDWASLGFWTLILFAAWRMHIYEKRDGTFRIVQFITSSDGRADKYSLAYVLTMLVGLWSIWFLVINGELTEWLWTSFLAAFVLGAVAKTAATVTERVKTAQAAAAVTQAAVAGATASDSPPDPGVETTTTTQTTTAKGKTK